MALNQTGVALFEAPVNGPQTVICGGVPRGGTSMVAGAIHGLGVPMGNDLPKNIEDPLFNMDRSRQEEQSREDFLNDIFAEISKRNASKQSWGWKYPRVQVYLKDIIAEIQNPRLVMVTRDPIPSGLRATRKADKAPKRNEIITKQLQRQMRFATANLNLVMELKIPTFMVSYELAVRSPEVFLSEMAAFLGQELPSDLSELLGFMTPGTYKAPPR